MKSGFSLGAYWEERLRHQFNESGSGQRGFSLRYNSHVYHSKEKAVRQILSASGITLAGSQLLDIGCGTGFFESMAVADAASSLTGIDITQISVQQLQRRYPQFRFLQADIGRQDPLQSEETFDGIAAIDTLYCLLSDAEFETAFHMLARHLKPTGWMLVSDRFYRLWGSAPHVRFRSAERYRQIAASQGLSLERRLPLYTTLTRSVIPVLGHKLLNPWGGILERTDEQVRQFGDWTVRWIANLSLALFRKGAA